MGQHLTHEYEVVVVPVPQHELVHVFACSQHDFHVSQHDFHFSQHDFHFSQSADLHLFPVVQDLDRSCFFEVTLALYAFDSLLDLSTALYVVLDLTPVNVAVEPDWPAQVLTPDPESAHVQVNVTPSVVPVWDFVHVIVGFISSFQ